MSLQEIQSDAAKPHATSAELAELAELQLQYETEVAQIQDRLKEANDKLRSISEEALPNAMIAAGVSEFKLTNGMKVTYKEDLKTSVPRNNKAAVIGHMREWGYDGAVKTEFVANLGKGNNQATDAFVGLAEKMNVDATVAEDIATATVKKALKERMREGKQDDLSLFGAFPYVRSIVK